MSVNPPLRLLAEFAQRYPDTEPSWLIKAPGRDVWVAAQTDDQRRHHTVCAPDCDVSQIRFDYRSARLRQTLHRRPLPRWSRYPAGVLVALAAQGELAFPGVSAVIIGEEPLGPRYEYGLGLAFAAFWFTVNNRLFDADALQVIVERVQRSYIGR